MAIFKLTIDKELEEALLARAKSDRRPPDWEAEVLLRQALGLPFPVQADEREGRR